jgi:autotransporter-associated beta strand protein
LNLSSNELITQVSSGVVVSMDGVVSGPSGRLTKSGPGTLVLSGVNTFTGAVTLNEGIVEVGSNQAFGSGGVLSLADAVRVTSTAVSSSGGDRTISNPYTFAGATVNLGSGAKNGVLTFDRQGTLGMSGSGLTLNADSDVKLMDGLTGGAKTLSKTGAGTLTLGGIGNYTGATTVGAGMLVLEGGNAIHDTAEVIVSSGATLRVASDETVGILNGGGSVRLEDSASPAVAPKLTISGAVDSLFSGNIVGSGSLEKSTSSTGVLTLTGTNTFAGGAALYAGVVEMGSSSAFGTGTVLMSGLASGLTLRSTDATPRAVTNNYRLSGPVTMGDWPVTMGGSSKTGLLEWTGLGTIDAPTNLQAKSVVSLKGPIDLQSNEFTVNVDFPSDPLDSTKGVLLLGKLTGDGSLKKLGVGALTLSGTNDFKGGAALNAGTVYVGSHSAFGDKMGFLTIAGAMVSSTSAEDRTIENDYSLGSTAVLGDVNRSGVLTFKGAGSLSGVTNLTARSGVILQGNISGPGGIVKDGTGDLTLKGDSNAYSGETTVTAGKLILDGLNAVPDGSAVRVNASGTLIVRRNETIGSLEGSGAVELDTGTLTIGGALLTA